jgi:Holliday junction resolvase RusA-like endonuclease
VSAGQSCVRFTVPLIPPSVNHYKKPRGRGYGFYVTKEAEAFKAEVARCCGGHSVTSERYQVSIRIFLGGGQRGDIDNFAKVTLDSLTAAGVIESDARVDQLEMFKARDAKNPRTEIEVKALEV